MLERHSYVVFGTDGNAPTIAHATHADAFSEAKRLSVKYPGRTFYVAQVAAVVVRNEYKFVGIEKNAYASLIGKEVFFEMNDGSAATLIGLSTEGWPIIESKQGAILKVDHIFNRVIASQPKVVKHPNVSPPVKNIEAARNELKQVLNSSKLKGIVDELGTPLQSKRYVLVMHGKDGVTEGKYGPNDALPHGYIRASIMRAFTTAKRDGYACGKVYCYGKIWSRHEIK